MSPRRRELRHQRRVRKGDKAGVSDKEMHSLHRYFMWTKVKQPRYREGERGWEPRRQTPVA